MTGIAADDLEAGVRSLRLPTPPSERKFHMTAPTCSNLSNEKLLLALLSGAVLGAVLVTVSSGPTGRELRSSIRALGNRLLGRTGQAGAETDEEILALFV